MAVRSHHVVRILQVIILLTVIYQLTLLLRPPNAFLSRPYIEDTFYAMSVARSIAQGDGFSVDGIQPTNGVQPLICLLNAPLFLISGNDSELALRFTYVLSILIYLFAAWMIAGFVRSLLRNNGEDGGGESGSAKRSLLFWSVFALVFCNYVVGLFYLNGLETGLAGGLAFAALWLYNTIVGDDSVRSASSRLLRYGVLGGLLGLCVLARIDESLLVVALLSAHFIHAHRRYSSLKGSLRWHKFGQTVLEVFVMGAAALLVSSPWWIYNYTTFGSLMPISGQSQQWLSSNMWSSIIETFNVLSDALLPGVHTPFWMRIGPFALYGVIGIPVAVGLLTLLPGVRDGLLQLPTKFAATWNVGSLIPVLLFTIFLVGFYTFFFRAPHFQPRYLVIPTIAVMLGLLLFFYTLWCLLAQGSAARIVLSMVLLLPMLLNFPFFARNFEEGGYYNFLVNASLWIDAHVKPGERVGMFQSGTNGFAHPNVVVNLDGKVNADALRAYQNGTLPRYVDSLRFDYLIDWDSYMYERLFFDTALRAKYRSVDTIPLNLIVWKRIESQGTPK